MKGEGRKEDERRKFFPESQRVCLRRVLNHKLCNRLCWLFLIVSFTCAVVVVLSRSFQQSAESTSANLLSKHERVFFKASNLKPAFSLSKGRTGVSIVLGIPTVKRDKQSYLLSTLDNLLVNMDEEEQNDTMIVVFVGETDLEYVRDIAKQIQLRFSKHCESGLIEVISPPASYYPNMKELRLTLNESINSVTWRSKQNLDHSFTMIYSKSKATYFLLLEDDVITKKNFVTRMKDFIEISNKRIVKKEGSWFILEFCQLGSIGKLFRSEDLLEFASFLQIFFNDQPGDWLLDLFMNVRYCGYIYADVQKCIGEKNKFRLLRTPSLFQHVGTFSSKKGRIQKLKDNNFDLVEKRILTFKNRTV